jgi:NADPH-dependent 2,4-dienoyl-CoA reductase/sulfur reductase-like enzyme/rhodanese-related sulfurtransferase
MPQRVVIIGGVAGGMSAATRLRRLDEFAEILLLERGPFVSFANCGLPYHLGGEIAERQKLIVQSPARLRAVFNLDIRINTEAISINRAESSVTFKNLGTGEIQSAPYDALILATGARGIVPNVPGIERPGHFPLRTIPDLDAVIAWIRNCEAKTAVVLGGGFIGLEAAEQLHRRGLKVSVVERNPQVLTPLDPEMAAHIHAELRKHGVMLHLKNPAVQFDEPRTGESAAASMVVLENGTRFPADVVIVGVGVRPESSLAKAAGLELGSSGGIRVDAHLQTSDAKIWAVGDALEVVHGVTKTPAVIPLAGPANRQGRIAADNICGIRSRYPGTWGTAIVRVFDQTAAVVGANEQLLRKCAIPYEVVHLHPNSHAGYYPGAKSIALKLLFSRESGRILGAQAIGADGVDKRIDVLATAIKGQLTVQDLAELELAYAPPFGSAKDPINLAGMAASNVLAQRVRVAQWHEVADLVARGAFVLDVREPNEREGGVIPGSVSIPLGELRERLKELPKDREILAHCASGQRSYNACRVLMQHGFTCRNLTGSFKTWSAASATG